MLTNAVSTVKIQVAAICADLMEEVLDSAIASDERDILLDGCQSSQRVIVSKVHVCQKAI
eukprot:5995743-Prymnesium_polylepis.1